MAASPSLFLRGRRGCVSVSGRHWGRKRGNGALRYRSTIASSARKTTWQAAGRAFQRFPFPGGVGSPPAQVASASRWIGDGKEEKSKKRYQYRLLIHQGRLRARARPAGDAGSGGSDNPRTGPLALLRDTFRHHSLRFRLRLQILNPNVADRSSSPTWPARSPSLRHVDGVRRRCSPHAARAAVPTRAGCPAPARTVRGLPAHRASQTRRDNTTGPREGERRWANGEETDSWAAR